MNNSVLLLLSVGLLVTGLVHNASALKCYQCNSVEHGVTACGHGKDVDTGFLTECGSPESGAGQGAKYDYCRKIITIIEFDVNNNTAQERITRKCGYLPSNYDDTCYYRGGFGGRQRVCTCKEDGCNSAPTLGGSTLLLSLFSGAALLLAFKKL